mgnify:FL=1
MGPLVRREPDLLCLPTENRCQRFWGIVCMLADTSQSSQFDASVVHDWLFRLYGRAAGYVSIVSTVDWAGKLFESHSFDWALTYITNLNSRPHEQGGAPKGIYARVTTLKRPPPPGSRGGDADSLCLPGLWADMDGAGPGHTTPKTLPGTLADCK